MPRQRCSEPVIDVSLADFRAADSGVAAARQLMTARRVLNRGLPPALITCPGLDVLLTLFIAAHDGEVVTLRSLETLTTVAPTVMLRLVAALVEEGLVERDSLTCALSAQGRAVVELALRNVASAWAGDSDKNGHTGAGSLQQ